MEKRQIVGVTILGVIAFMALGVGVFEKMSQRQAELAEKKRVEAAKYPEPILEAQPIPLTVDEMALEIESESSFEEEIMVSEESMQDEELASDLETINELTATYDESSF